MPLYRFAHIGADHQDQGQHLGFFNDEGALSYARRLQRSEVIEVWQQDRLVARLEPEFVLHPNYSDEPRSIEAIG